MTLLFRRVVTAGAVTAGLVTGVGGAGGGAVGESGAGGAGIGGRARHRQGAGVTASSRPRRGRERRRQSREDESHGCSARELHQPIVCQGQRVLNIDNRDIRFDGNAITAEDGCELHITNSRITAGGIAIRARNASVHIENSEIEGHEASIDAAGAAQIYAEASTFKGAARRLDQAAIHDLGNNNWL